MKVVNLGENPSVLNNFIAEMRDATIQKDRLRFRTNLERVGEIFAYERPSPFPDQSRTRRRNLCL